MSPRRKALRKVVNPPLMKGFKPFGAESGIAVQESVVLLLEEYEALRLCDYDRYNQLHASELMCVSRPTLTRIYASALQKIAKAFVEGRQIVIEGGKVYFDSDWYHCKGCRSYFDNPEKNIIVQNCPLCGSLLVEGYNLDSSREDGATDECDDYCVCPGCGFRQEKIRGMPCNQEICPECGTTMKRGIKPVRRNSNHR